MKSDIGFDLLDGGSESLEHHFGHGVFARLLAALLAVFALDVVGNFDQGAGLLPAVRNFRGTELLDLKLLTDKTKKQLRRKTLFSFISIFRMVPTSLTVSQM